MKTLRYRYSEGGLGPDVWRAAEALAEDFNLSRKPYSRLAATVRNGNEVLITLGDEVLPCVLDAVVVGNPGEIHWLIDGTYVLTHDEALDRLIEVLREHQ